LRGGVHDKDLTEFKSFDGAELFSPDLETRMVSAHSHEREKTTLHRSSTTTSLQATEEQEHKQHPTDTKLFRVGRFI